MVRLGGRVRKSKEKRVAAKISDRRAQLLGRGRGLARDGRSLDSRPLHENLHCGLTSMILDLTMNAMVVAQLGERSVVYYYTGRASEAYSCCSPIAAEGPRSGMFRTQ